MDVVLDELPVDDVGLESNVTEVSMYAGFSLSIYMTSSRLFICIVKCLSVRLMTGNGPS